MDLFCLANAAFSRSFLENLTRGNELSPSWAVKLCVYHSLFLQVWDVLPLLVYNRYGRPARTTKSELTTTEDNTLEEKPQLNTVTSSTQ
ncbi:hypothetical protein ACHWQZ_G011268 [Mnemiopsis leidyi]